MKRNTKGQAGFTLIEIMVVLALIGIVLIVSFSMLSFGNINLGATQDKLTSQQDVRTSINAIMDNIRYTTSAVLMPVSTCKTEISSKSGYNYLYFENGSVHVRVYNSTNQTYSDITYGETIVVPGSSFVKVNNYTVDITVATKENNTSFSGSSNMTFMNLKQLGGTITTSGSAPFLGIKYITLSRSVPTSEPVGPGDATPSPTPTASPTPTPIPTRTPTPIPTPIPTPTKTPTPTPIPTPSPTPTPLTFSITTNTSTRCDILFNKVINSSAEIPNSFGRVVTRTIVASYTLSLTVPSAPGNGVIYKFSVTDATGTTSNFNITYKTSGKWQSLTKV